MIATRDDLGIGIYSPEEAAFYARVPTQLMKRWIFGDGKGSSVLVPQIRDQSDDGKVVTFLDFIQALAIRAIRNDFKIPLQKIREAVMVAREQFGVEYPFAARHTTFLFSDQRREGHGEILIRKDRDKAGAEEQFIQISGKKKGNFVIKEVVECYLDDLHFDEKSGLATEYLAWSGAGGNITMNPHRRFGEPIISSCGYPAVTLYEASINEGGLEAAAEAYGVKREEVRLACSYIDHLKTISR